MITDPGQRWSVVLSIPPFGRKSSLTMVGADGREVREDREIERQDFVVTTSNKQLNFVQHIHTILDTHGRAAGVLPDTGLCAGGAGETIRRKLLRTCDQVVLNVRADTPPARQAYRRLGFAELVRFEERLVHRLGSPWSQIAAPLRRLLASRKENRFR